MKNTFDKWLNKYYKQVYYQTWESKVNSAEYIETELKEIYKTIIERNEV